MARIRFFFFRRACQQALRAAIRANPKRTPGSCRETARDYSRDRGMLKHGCLDLNQGIKRPASLRSWVMQVQRQLFNWVVLIAFSFSGRAATSVISPGIASRQSAASRIAPNLRADFTVPSKRHLTEKKRQADIIGVRWSVPHLQNHLGAFNPAGLANRDDRDRALEFPGQAIIGNPIATYIQVGARSLVADKTSHVAYLNTSLKESLVKNA